MISNPLVEPPCACVYNSIPNLTIQTHPCSKTFAVVTQPIRIIYFSHVVSLTAHRAEKKKTTTSQVYVMLLGVKADVRRELCYALQSPAPGLHHDYGQIHYLCNA